MTRRVIYDRIVSIVVVGVIVAVGGLGLVGVAQEAVSSPGASPQVQALATRVNQLMMTNEALINSLVTKQHTIDQLQQQLVGMIPRFEQANPGKTLDPDTLVIKDKPDEVHP